MKLLDDVLNQYRIRKHKVNIGNQVKLNGACYFSTAAGGNIKIGDNVIINSGERYNRIGGDTRTIMQTLGEGVIEVGNYVGISNAAIIARNRVIIEDHVLIGGGVKIYDNDFHSLAAEIRKSPSDQNNISSKPVLIKTGAFVGAHSIILKGVTIGKNSIIGAGSVVTHDVPDDEVWGGNPARKIKKAP